MKKTKNHTTNRAAEVDYIKIVKTKKKEILDEKLLTKEEIAKMNYFKPMELIVDYISLKTQNNDRGFFRLITIYMMATMASSMRTTVNTQDRGKIPVNVYSFNFANSGAGKGYSVYLTRSKMLSKFVRKYFRSTHEDVARSHIYKQAIKQSLKTGLPEQKEFASLLDVYQELGESLFTFDSGTTPAVKQYRSKLAMGKTGSLNMIIDEVGSTLSANGEILTAFLELFDMGVIGDKLLKETKESKRIPMTHSSVPANLMLFGTPARVYDGAATEKLMREYITIGMGRRCFFNFSPAFNKDINLNASAIYEAQTKSSSDKFLKNTTKYFGSLANEMYHGQVLQLPRVSAILLIRYEIYCLVRASKLPRNAEDERAHLMHAHWRVLKLAGVYAFIDKSKFVKVNHVQAAIKISEDSHRSFRDKVLKQEQNFIRLAKFIGEAGVELTHADLIRDLAFFPQNKMQRDELMQLAIAWGSTNNIAIKVHNQGSIETIKGSMLKATNCEKLIISYSKDHHTHGYQNINISAKNLAKFTQGQGWHFINHHLKSDHRHTKEIKKGFNMVILDIDSAVHIETVKIVLKKYNFVLYTTKRHKIKKPRFRIVMPISHVLHLKEKQFASFMDILFKWLPFKVDKQTNQRNRKWLTDTGACYVNDGKLLDVLKFIPKTPKAKEIIKFRKNYSSFDQLERWYISRIIDGNRSNTLIKYALVMLDKGMSFKAISKEIHDFNKRLGANLAIPKSEINNTVLLTIENRIKKGKKRKK